MTVIGVEVIELELMTGTPSTKESHSFSSKNIRSDGSYARLKPDHTGEIHFKDGCVYNGQVDF
jgi:hypothetical protein